MASVIEVFGADGTLQSVSLHSQVRADEVVNAIARRRGISPEMINLFTLFQVVAWRKAWAPLGAAFFAADAVKSCVELKKLAPDDRPLKVRAQCEVRVKQATRALEEEALSKNMQLSIRTTIAFAFLDCSGEQVFQENFEEIMSRGNPRNCRGSDNGPLSAGPTVSQSNSPLAQSPSRPGGRTLLTDSGSLDGESSTDNNHSQNSIDGPHYEFAPINTLGRGEKCGFLFERSVANPREWQRRWCVLRKAELVHSLNSSGGLMDFKTILLNQNHVKPIPPAALGGLKHCFEIDTPHDVLQFRAKTEDEAKGWINAITAKVALASENEKFHLAERMIEDGQRASCLRDEFILETAMGSLRGLLSSHAGADRLYRFAKRLSLGKRGERNGELVAFYLDLERAHAAFSSMPGGDGSNPKAGPNYDGDGCTSSSFEIFPSQNPSQYRYLSSLSSIASSSGSSVTGATLRGSAAALSRKEWMIQICERFLTLFEPPEPPSMDGGSAADYADADSNDQGDVQQVGAVLRATDSLRIELVDENLQFIPRESCIVVIEEARQVVRHNIETGLYQDFLASKDYERIIASIPSRVRSR